MSDQFEEQGYIIVKPLLSVSECNDVIRHIDELNNESAGTRNLLQAGWCSDLAALLRNRISNIWPALGNMVTFQCTLFDKSEEQNWLVPFHQDLSIPVREKVDSPEISGWSVKEGVIYAQPPVEFLEKLVAVRLQLDASGAGDGPLRVIPGSHNSGRIDSQQVAVERASQHEMLCEVEQGGVLIMRPLLLHASSKATNSGFRRRVLHFGFGPSNLPNDLQWNDSV